MVFIEEFMPHQTFKTQVITTNFLDFGESIRPDINHWCNAGTTVNADGLNHQICLLFIHRQYSQPLIF
jgi:hypothetical protein